VTQSSPDALLELAVLTTQDVARLSGFATKTVLRAIRAGDLVASKVRGKYRVWPADYRRWIDGRRVAPSPNSSEGAPVPLPLPVSGSASRLRALETQA
jgi:hypothetical protein